jgi:hypothetical protein
MTTHITHTDHAPKEGASIAEGVLGQTQGRAMQEKSAVFVFLYFQVSSEFLCVCTRDMCVCVGVWVCVSVCVCIST